MQYTLMVFRSLLTFKVKVLHLRVLYFIIQLVFAFLMRATCLNYGIFTVSQTVGFTK